MQVVSLCRDRNTKDKTFDKTAFACGYVILRVTSQVLILFAVDVLDCTLCYVMLLQVGLIQILHVLVLYVLRTSLRY